MSDILLEGAAANERLANDVRALDRAFFQGLRSHDSRPLRKAVQDIFDREMQNGGFQPSPEGNGGGTGT